MTRAQIEEKLKKKKERLELYYTKETEMLSPHGVQAYGVGNRNVSRYQFDLSNLRAQIKELETDIEELENKLSSQKPRRAVSVVPRDW